MNDTEFFELYRSSGGEIELRLIYNEYYHHYHYCTRCKICPIRNKCDEVYGSNDGPELKVEDSDIIKEKYPEHFI